MKRGEHNNSAEISSVLRIALVAVALMALILPGNAMAARERYVLDYGDSHLSSHRGQPATLFLKKALRDQYPWVDIGDLELRRVVLIARSQRGRGSAQLQVGHQMTEPVRVEGRFGRFRDDRREAFDRIHFSNPSRGSDGPWQIDLRGNIVVNKVVLEVDERSRRHHYPPRRDRF
jgi:hypothetical protein